MKAIRVHQPGGPEQLRYEDVPEPAPRDLKEGEALVRIEAIGVNFVDVYLRKGIYKSALPFTLGQEAAGTVVAVGPGVGPGVGEVQVGDRVAYASVPGAYAQLPAESASRPCVLDEIAEAGGTLAAVPSWRLVPIPARLDVKQAAAAMLQGMTAHYLATTTFPLKAGDTCVVHAAAGGVGLLLCQIAKRRGARVIGTTSTPEKAALAREAGADEVILYKDQDFVAEVKRLTGGKGAQVIYDSVGQTTFLPGLDCLALRGTMVLYGASSGPVPAFDLQVLNQKGSLFVTRPSLHHYTHTPQELRERAGDVLGWIQDGSLKLRITREFPLEEAAEAHRALEGRGTTGKLLLIP